MLRHMSRLFIASLLAVACCRAATAQANFSESFEGVGSGEPSGGPPTLVSEGWIFRNQSQPAGTGVSPYWAEFGGWGQSGSALGHGGFATWQSSTTKISAWIILPAIPNQQAGDPMSIWTAAPTNAFGVNNATIEFRYSPTGGTSTGSGANDVGHFTQALLTVPCAGGHDWTQRVMTLPGTGRIAMRLTLGPVPASVDFTGSILLDSLQIGVPPPAPYPLPAPGQTVHWTSAHSPVSLARNGAGQNPVIPAGGAVVVDAGVEVRVASGAQLEIAGTLRMEGSEALPVRLRGPGSFRTRKGGLVEAQFADVQAFIDLIYGARAAFTDCAFSDPSHPTTFSYDSAGDIGHRFFDGNLDYARQILSLTRCSFGQGCDVALLRGWLAARDCTFQSGGVVSAEPGPIGGEAMFIVGASILDNVVVTDAYIDLMHNHDQRRYVGATSVSGNIHGPGIRLQGGGNYLIDETVELSGNKWPVAFGFNSAGLLPGSRLPTSGNQLNEIPDTDDPAPLDERVVWADAGIPYVHLDNSVSHGQVTILPGVTVKVGPDVSFFFDTDSNGVAQPVFLGEPERPIRFMPYTPGAPWYSLTVGNTRWYGVRWDWCIFEGSRYGVSSAELPIAADNCVFRNNKRAFYSEVYTALRKCTFENNVYSYSAERFAPNHTVMGFLDANHPTNPNSFINNHGNPLPEFFNSFLPSGGLIARARHNSLENTDSDVRNNWWGTPTGPSEPRNPGGTGDAVFFGIDAGGFLLPFLTEPPTSNPPPIVRFVTTPGDAVPGEKMHLQWTARDDGTITAQRVYYSPDSNADQAMQLLATIPASARSFEWTVPAIGTPPNGADQFMRVVAVDDLGQEGIADLPVKILNPSDFTGSLVQSTVIPPVVRPGDSIDACAVPMGVIGSVYATLELDNDDAGVSLGGVFVSGGSACTVLPIQIPDVSTDRARLRFDATASLNQARSYYGPYFAIRPDPILGDSAPTISLVSQHSGAAYNAGGVVPIAWTASDDEALRSFDIRASLDGGVRWFIVARDLPADARSYDWRLPASAGVASAKLRVVAHDLRFQNASAESGAFSIAPGGYSQPCPGDANGDGEVDFADLNIVLNQFGQTGAGLAGDINADGAVNFADLNTLLGNYNSGC